MIPLLTRSEARALDADAVERLGLPSLLLMENAGAGACAAIRDRYQGALSHVVIVGGPGQNGGDGWVVARHLFNLGVRPQLFLVGARDRVRGDAQVNLRALAALGLAVTTVATEELPALSAALAGASLVVDALFGTGLDRALAGPHAAVVERIRGCAAPVVALDLPSGVDADTGAVLGVAVRADRTLTFGAHKRGLHQHPGAALAGAIDCVSIGVPPPVAAESMLLEASDVPRWLAPRAADAHKGVAGHVLVVAGAAGRTGAALLSGLGALRAGAGLVTLAGRGGAQAALDAKVIELMTAELAEGADAAFESVRALSAGKQAAVIGPGLGLDPQGRALARRLSLECELPAVLDADALTAIGQDLAALRAAPAPRVLTPHPGEAARLLGCGSQDVQGGREAAARRIASETRAVVVLKGAGTVVAAPDGRARVCSAGSPAMAVAGTGDVLSGVIGALLAQGLDRFDAAAAGVYLHARAGELAASGDRGLLASELARALPRAIAGSLFGALS